MSPPETGERFETLLACKGVMIERIVSSSRLTSHEYIQEQDEWAILLNGEAVLEIAGKRVPLTSGDHIFLPSNTPHSVVSVSNGALWLAVHI